MKNKNVLLILLLLGMIASYFFYLTMDGIWRIFLVVLIIFLGLSFLLFLIRKSNGSKKVQRVAGTLEKIRDFIKELFPLYAIPSPRKYRTCYRIRDSRCFF